MGYAYKVVKETDKPGVFQSLYEVCPVKYRIGKKTVAPVGGLICYSNTATEFNEAHSDRRLFRVRVAKPVKLPAYRFEIAKKSLALLRELWDRRFVSGYNTWALYWALYTVAFKEVTLLYEVDPHTKKRIK